MVGEIFRYNGKTYQCVADSDENDCWEKCEIPSVFCDEYFSCDLDRADKIEVHFICVTEPKEGMLFRAYDGVLYELREKEAGKCYRYFSKSICCCGEIDKQAFGKMFTTNFHWYPVEENKEEKDKMEEKRHLELAVVKVEGDQVTFRIAEQTHRGESFTFNGCVFRSSSGYTMVSQDCPEFKKYTCKLFVRGMNSGADNYQITVSMSHFAKIMEAVNEYNETDGKGYEKKFPEEGDTFYCITSAMTVSLGEFGSSMDGYEFKMRDAGNCFQTFEEAKAALERVKKALKGEYK